MATNYSNYNWYDEMLATLAEVEKQQEASDDYWESGNSVYFSGAAYALTSMISSFKASYAAYYGMLFIGEIASEFLEDSNPELASYLGNEYSYIKDVEIGDGDGWEFVENVLNGTIDFTLSASSSLTLLVNFASDPEAGFEAFLESQEEVGKSLKSLWLGSSSNFDTTYRSRVGDGETDYIDLKIDKYDNYQFGIGHGGSDYIANANYAYGGDDADYLENNDSVWGGTGDDFIINANLAYGDEGDDYLLGVRKADGGDGNDYIIGTDSADTLRGGSQNSYYTFNPIYSSSTNISIFYAYTDGRHSRTFFNYISTSYENVSADGNDYIEGHGGNDLIYGNDGDDTLDGGDGNDKIYGGEGNDLAAFSADSDFTVSFSSSSYTITGQGTDTIYDIESLFIMGGASNNKIDASVFAHSTLLDGAGGNDTLLGSSGTDLLNGGDGADSLQGNNGDDYLDGGDSNDSLKGGDGNDTLDGGSGNDQLYGGNNDDYLQGSYGNDYLAGNQGNDSLYGNVGNDTLNGDSGDDSLSGWSGNDKLYGNVGNDTMYGGSGADYLSGWSGNDKLYGDNGNDTMYGGSGNDYLSGWYGNDKLYGWTGNDTMYGGSGNDTIYGQNDKDKLYGWYGNDKLYGGNGNDTLYGSYNNDTLYGDSGNDYLDGGNDKDYLYGGDNNDTLYGGSGDDYLYGENGNDTLYGGNNNDTLYGSSGSDKLYGENGNDYLNSGSGNDTLYGGNNNDTLHGDSGNDYLHGGSGNDTINGASGFDTLTGGSGSDVFKFDSSDGFDVINDYNKAQGDSIKVNMAYYSGSINAYNSTYNGESGTFLRAGSTKIAFLNGVSNFNTNNVVQENAPGCFITTATAENFGWADDCQVLETLRWFRDNVMAQRDDWKADIATYYAIAPKIVELTKGDRELYNKLWNRYIKRSVAAIVAGNYERAYAIYRNMVELLTAQYLN